MRHHRLREKRKNIPFFIPLIIACVIVIGSVFLIRWLINKEDSGITSNTPVAYFTLTSGSARVLFSDGLGYRVDPSTDAVNVNIGEGVETMGTTNLELTLQDGSIVRLGENSTIKIQEFKSIDNKKKVALVLEKGNAWVSTSKETIFEKFDFILDRSKLSDIKGIFALEKTETTNIYRGIQGSAKVVIEQQDKDPLLSQAISLGQQIIIDESLKKALEEKKNIELLSLIDSDFRDSSWYTYNTKRDNGDISLARNNNENITPTTSDNTNAIEKNEDPVAPESENTNTAISIKIIGPTEGSIISDSVATIYGSVKGNVSKVMIDEYVLQKFTPGSATWQYFASLEAGNLKKGKNTITAYALDSQGAKSNPFRVTFTYDPTKSSTQDAKVPTFTAPTNGKELTTTDNKIIISGTVDKNAEKVMINDYVLQRYVKGSGVWQYYAYESYETLSPGVNTYTVYSVDKSGKKSKSATLTINYKKNGTGSGSSL